MANELNASGLVAGSTYYAIIRNAAGLYFNTSPAGFEALNGAHFANYAVGAAVANGAGDWSASFPSVAAGDYSYTVRLTPSDVVMATGTVSWSGTAELPGGVNVTFIGGSSANPISPPFPVIVANQDNAATSVTAIGLGNSTTFTGATITGSLNYPFGWQWTYSGMDLTGWSQVVFTAKTSPALADAAASLTVKLSAPGAGTDGLTVLNGAPIASPTLASDGALTVTVTPASGNTPVKSVVTLNLTARGMALAAPGTLFWEMTWLLGGVKQSVLDGGQFGVEPSIRANPVAS